MVFGIKNSNSAIWLIMELSDIFYTNNPNSHVHVKLNEHGFTLRRESTVAGASGCNKSKQQEIAMDTIVGSRCLCVKKSRSLSSRCLCSSSSRHVLAGLDMADVSGDNGGSHKNGSEQSADATEDNGTATVDRGDGSAYLYIFAYILKPRKRRIASNRLRRERTVLTLRFRSFDSFEENMQEACRWHETLRSHKKRPEALLSRTPETAASNRLLIFLNPKSGSGKAREVFHHEVAPVLNEAEVPYELHVTQHANYARQFVRSMVIGFGSSGIVAVGGDGLFYEILNGLLQRNDWPQLMRSTALGIVPCGSGNGLARSIAHECNEPYNSKPALASALAIVQHHNSGLVAPMDVVRIELRNQKLYSFLSVGWGLISDIDIESERLRALGYQRFTLWTLLRLFSLRTYSGRVSYLPRSTNETAAIRTAAAWQRKGGELSHSASCDTPPLGKCNRGEFRSVECIGDGADDDDYADVVSCETTTAASASAGADVGNNATSFRSRCNSWLSAGSQRSTYYSITDSLYQSVAEESSGAYSEQSDGEPTLNGGRASPACRQRRHAAHQRGLGEHRDKGGAPPPPLTEPLPSNWVVEEGEFIMVQAAYQSHLGVNCFFAPAARLSDGLIYLVVIRAGISRAHLLHFLMGMSSGTHLPAACEAANGVGADSSSRAATFVKVIPVSAFRIEPLASAPTGILTVDGERVELGPIQGHSIAGLARVMVPQ